MTGHIEFEKLISAYFDGWITPHEKDLVENHLKECPSCRTYYEELSKLSSNLKSWQDESLSPDLEQRIKKRVENLKSKKEREMENENRFLLTRVGSGILGVLVLVFVLQIYSQRGIQGRLKQATDDISDQYQVGNKNVVTLGRMQLARQTEQEKDLKTKIKDSKKEFQLEAEGKIDKLAKATAELTSTTEDKRSQLAMAPAESQRGNTLLMDEITSKPTDLGLIDANYEFWGGSLSSLNRAEPGKRQGKICIIPPGPQPESQQDFNTEQYDRIYENEFLEVKDNPLSTFSIDVDTASYSNIRRFLQSGQLPPKDAVRIEEMINYFTYDYPQPKEGEPFSISTEISWCPWNNDHQVLLIGLQGKTLKEEELPPSNLVFLIDVSGSMEPANKLPLLKSAFRLLINQLRPEERIAIVTYAGAAGLVLESTPGSEKEKILQALDRLQAGGSTAGGAGIQLAYKVAKENFIQGGNNRVILATDGDFNIGVSSDGELTRIIEEKRKEGIFLTALGFGYGNYKDSKLEKLADKGNGNYYYIDTMNEAKKVLVSELGSLLFTIAKDVKIQIEFNPNQVKVYRLIGYENRVLAKEDFNDDTKDAGELGAGHSVTALYEIIPASSKETFGQVDDLAYQKTVINESNDLMTIKLRYKNPKEEESRLVKKILNKEEIKPDDAISENFMFASAVAEFGLLLRDSQFKGKATFSHALNQARQSQGKDPFGYRAELIKLMEQAELLSPQSPEGGYQFKNQAK